MKLPLLSQRIPLPSSPYAGSIFAKLPYFENASMQSSSDPRSIEGAAKGSAEEGTLHTEGFGWNGAAAGTGSAPGPPESPSTDPGPGFFPLTPGQKSLWFMQQILPASAVYHIALAVRILHC